MGGRSAIAAAAIRMLNSDDAEAIRPRATAGDIGNICQNTDVPAGRGVFVSPQVITNEAGDIHIVVTAHQNIVPGHHECTMGRAGTDGGNGKGGAYPPPREPAFS